MARKKAEEMTTPPSLAGRYEEVGIGLIDANAWNPNKMQDKTFDRLCREIEENGMNSPLQLVPIRQEDGTFRYRIIGGEHRFQACRVLGYKFIPAIIMEGDEDVQKFITMRLNVITGAVDPAKMVKMYNDLLARHGKEAMADLLGYTDKDAFAKLVGEVKAGAKKAGLPKEAIAEIEKATKELKTVDNLGAVLNQIFTKYGDTVPSNFVWFEFGGKKHVSIACAPKTWKVIETMLAKVYARGAKADEVFAALMEVWDEVVDLEHMKGNAHAGDGHEDRPGETEDAEGAQGAFQDGDGEVDDFGEFYRDDEDDDEDD